MNPMLIGALLVGIGILFLLLRKKPKELYNPFKPYLMMTYIKCQKCDFRFNRPFVRGDFIMKELTEPNSEGWLERCKKCDGILIIDGIFYEKEISAEYKALIDKWQ